MTEIDPQTIRRRCHRALLMVGELHKRGYQKLRIAPTRHQLWRLVITPASNISAVDGSRLAVYEDPLQVVYTSGTGNLYFGWSDRTQANARELADTFVNRFPRVVEAARGRDWLYAGWYVEMLGLAEQGWFPYAYSDSDEGGLALDALEGSGVDLTKKPVLPLPPPGEHTGT